jgi:hypothetical protein
MKKRQNILTQLLQNAYLRKRRRDNKAKRRANNKHLVVVHNNRVKNIDYLNIKVGTHFTLFDFQENLIDLLQTIEKQV